MDAVTGAETWRGVSIVYCDNHVLIAVKPPNMPSQADESGDRDMFTEMKAYVKERFQKPGEVYLGLLHRLDRPVGGLMAFARTSKAAARLSEQLRVHDMRRGYLCVAQGEARAQARLENVLTYDDGSSKQAALTYERLGFENGLSFLRVSLETGRKHQIRRQLQLAGLPLWGDARTDAPHYEGAHAVRLFPAGRVSLEFVHKPFIGNGLIFSFDRRTIRAQTGRGGLS